MDTDTRNRLLEALGIAESIALRLRLLMSGKLSDKSSAKFCNAEYADMARTLSDIEDRLHGSGEYAPENAGSTRGGAR